jgi:hypothetical protein
MLNKEGTIKIYQIPKFRKVIIILICILSFFMLGYSLESNAERALIDLKWASAQPIPGELPPNDFRISRMGLDGDISIFAKDAAVAYNPTNDEFLVVWRGTLPIPAGPSGETEVFGQLINGADGKLVGNMMRISFVGLEGDGDYHAYHPDVTYNSTLNEFLVVWESNELTSVPSTYELEIWGQRLTYAANGNLEKSGGVIRISNMGPDGNAGYKAKNAAVVHNTLENQYLVVWEGVDTAPLDLDYEIFGQYLRYFGGTFISLGSDFRISQMGPGCSPTCSAGSPDIAFNPDEGQYLVVWSGRGKPVDKHNEIYGRLISSNGYLNPQQKFSYMGPVGETEIIARGPEIAYGPANSEWLLVWEGSNRLPMEMEIFGQFLKYAPGGTLTQTGTNNFHISDAGPDGDDTYYAHSPELAFDPIRRVFLVVWYGNDSTGTWDYHDHEVFGQILGADTRNEIGYNDFPLSDMGPAGNTDYSASEPVIAYSNKSGNFLVAWHGDDDVDPLVNDELEIFGQRYQVALPNFLPVIMR